MNRFKNRVSDVRTTRGRFRLGLQMSDFGNSYSAVRQTPTAKVDLSNEGVTEFIGPHRNQMQTSACGGYCISDNLRVLQAKLHRNEPSRARPLSALDAYWWARPERHRDEDNGVLTSDLLRVINHTGACEREFYPDDADPLRPPQGLKEYPRFKAPLPFEHVANETTEEIHGILHGERLPVVLLLRLFDQSTQDAVSTGVLRPPTRGDAPIGGHATTGTRSRYVDNTLMVCARFSWGAMRSDDGTIAIHPDYFKEGHVVALAPPPDLY